MYPPADPWGTPEDPTPPMPPRTPPLSPRPKTTPPMYGRATVPSVPLREPTAEMPVLRDRPPLASRSSKPVSWQRTGRASRRSLSDGWGLTATGLIVVFCGWGTWAAAGRGTIGAPLVGLGLVLLVGVGVFCVSRLMGYVVLERVLNRPRLHARWSHFLTGLFLTVAGVSYLSNTTWIIEGVQWIRDQTGRL